MTTLTREQPALVVFWTLCERQSYEDKRYKKTKMATEFPPETEPEKAIESIYATYGRVTDLNSNGRPTKVHAKVSTCSVIHPHERGEIESWKATEEPLFDAATLQACISFKRQPGGPF